MMKIKFLNINRLALMTVYPLWATVLQPWYVMDSHLLNVLKMLGFMMITICCFNQSKKMLIFMGMLLMFNDKLSFYNAQGIDIFNGLSTNSMGHYIVFTISTTIFICFLMIVRNFYSKLINRAVVKK